MNENMFLIADFFQVIVEVWVEFLYPCVKFCSTVIRWCEESSGGGGLAEEALKHILRILPTDTEACDVVEYFQNKKVCVWASLRSFSLGFGR